MELLRPQSDILYVKELVIQLVEKFCLEMISTLNKYVKVFLTIPQAQMNNINHFNQWPLLLLLDSQLEVVASKKATDFELAALSSVRLFQEPLHPFLFLIRHHLLTIYYQAGRQSDGQAIFSREFLFCWRAV